MLGSSIGVKDADGFQPLARQAFGAAAEDADASADFFTGKPRVEGLGHAFLFRNYRPELGKWQTADPIGYPDGWNNFAYVNNWVNNAVDPLGLVIREPNQNEMNSMISLLNGLRSLNNPFLSQLSENMSMSNYMVDDSLRGTDTMGYINRIDVNTIYMSPELFDGTRSQGRIPTPDGNEIPSLLLEVMVHENAHLDAIWERGYWWEKFIDDGVHDWIDDYVKNINELIFKQLRRLNEVVE